MSKKGFISSLDVEIILIKMCSQGKVCIEDLLEKVTEVANDSDIQDISIDFDSFIEVMLDIFKKSNSEGKSSCQRIALDLLVLLEEYHSSYEVKNQYLEAGEVMDVIKNLFKSELHRRQHIIMFKHKENEEMIKKAHEHQRNSFDEGE